MVAVKFFQSPMVTEGEEVLLTRTDEVAPGKHPGGVGRVLEGEANPLLRVEAGDLRCSRPLHLVIRVRVRCLVVVMFPSYEGVTGSVECCTILRMSLCTSTAVVMNLNQIFFTLTPCIRKDCLH
jgi:hypothetical protein